MLTFRQKKYYPQGYFISLRNCYYGAFGLCADVYCFGKLPVYAVSAVLYRDYAIASRAAYNSNIFTAIAPEREQKRIQLIVVCFDIAYDIFNSQLCLY